MCFNSCFALFKCIKFGVAGILCCFADAASIQLKSSVGTAAVQGNGNDSQHADARLTQPEPEVGSYRAGGAVPTTKAPVGAFVVWEGTVNIDRTLSRLQPDAMLT